MLRTFSFLPLLVGVLPLLADDGDPNREVRRRVERAERVVEEEDDVPSPSDRARVEERTPEREVDPREFTRRPQPRPEFHRDGNEETLRALDALRLSVQALHEKLDRLSERAAHAHAYPAPPQVGPSPPPLSHPLPQVEQHLRGVMELLERTVQENRRQAEQIEQLHERVEKLERTPKAIKEPSADKKPAGKKVVEETPVPKKVKERKGEPETKPKKSPKRKAPKDQTEARLQLEDLSAPTPTLRDFPSGTRVAIYRGELRVGSARTR